MNSKKATEFLERHGMSPERVDVLECAVRMRKDMELGLAGSRATLPMIPTYLRNDGEIKPGLSAIVVDAGGTNFRCGVAEFGESGCELRDVTKRRMPGIEKSATWDEFISFVADSVMPIADRSDRIGFCFSYSADITPEIDGRVIRIDKEVVITGCEGQLVGESLTRELSRRGVKGKRVFIINDTAAVLLGGSAKLDKSRYGGFIGQVSGTGTNTCCILPLRRITKLGRDEDTRVIVNLESGTYDGLPRGDFDLELDALSNNPGEKLMEKLTAGVYLGELCRLAISSAAGEGLLSAETAERVRALGRFDSAVVDAWACGEGLDGVCAAEGDADFIRTLCRTLFERSARCMCVNLMAILMLTGEGTDPEKPVCICAEGSLVQKSRCYRPALERLLEENGALLGRHIVFNVDYETTLPGSAAAALLN